MNKQSLKNILPALFFTSKRNTIFLSLILSGLIFHIDKTLSNTCYDVTTDHQCKQSDAKTKPNKDSFNNQGLVRDYQVQRIVSSFSERISCGNISVPSEKNIIDIYQLIEQAQLTEREQFVCKMSVEIRKKMKNILEDREFMKNYIEKKKTNAPINKEDKIKMTALLIKYRLLKNKDNICDPYVTRAEECYFSSARFEVPSEVFIEINKSATKYIDQLGEPQKCFFNRREYPLDSTQCENEILSRVQVIPAPLILAQAAQESGWGNQDNKWVSEYNNLLGLQIQFSNPPTMSCYKNCRCAGSKKSRCALKFTDISGSFYEYSMRFNASPHQAYKKFREARKALQNINEFDDINTQCQNARALIPYIKNYAEERKYMQLICNRLNNNICEIVRKCPTYKLI